MLSGPRGEKIYGKRQTLKDNERMENAFKVMKESHHRSCLAFESGGDSRKAPGLRDIKLLSSLERAQSLPCALNFPS